MTRQVEHVKDRRRLGLCAYGGCPEKTGVKYRCAKHAEEHAALMRRCYEAKKRKAREVGAAA